MSDKRTSQRRTVLLDSALIKESVARLTGWALRLDDVRVDEMSRSQLERRVVADRLRRTGVPAGHLKGREVFSSYLYSENVILYNSDLLSEVSESEAQKNLFLAFVRAAQRQVYPEFFLSTDALSREAILMGRHGGDVPVDERVRRCGGAQDKLQARMGFAEGHASVLYAAYAQHEGLVVSLLEPSLEALLALSEGADSRLSHYISGVMVVNEVFSRYPEMIDSLYSNPALVEQVFGEGGLNVPTQERAIVDSARPAW